MNSRYVTIVLFFVFTNAQLETSCPLGWLHFENRCYRLTDSKNLTFEDAFNECQRLGGSLATIKSSSLMRFLETNLTHHSSLENSHIYIGAIRVNRKGQNQFRWLDGSSINFGYWWKKQPDNSHSNEYCVSMLILRGYEVKYDIIGTIPITRGWWHDIDCHSKHAALCEKSIYRQRHGRNLMKFSTTIRDLYAKYHSRSKTSSTTWAVPFIYTLLMIAVMFSVMLLIYGVIMRLLHGISAK